MFNLPEHVIPDNGLLPVHTLDILGHNLDVTHKDAVPPSALAILALPQVVDLVTPYVDVL